MLCHFFLAKRLTSPSSKTIVSINIRYKRFVVSARGGVAAQGRETVKLLSRAEAKNATVGVRHRLWTGAGVHHLIG